MGMARRRLLTKEQWARFLAVADDERAMVRHYTLGRNELDIVSLRRTPPRPTVVAPYEAYLRERVTGFPELTASRLLREVRARGYTVGYRPDYRAQVWQRSSQRPGGRQHGQTAARASGGQTCGQAPIKVIGIDGKGY
ncbi:hypothetical protein [Azospirillum argentinense]